MADALQASVDNLVEVNNSTNAESRQTLLQRCEAGMLLDLLALTGGMLAVARRKKRETDLDLKANVLMTSAFILIGKEQKCYVNSI